MTRKNIIIRNYQQSDARSLVDIFYNTSHIICAKDYTKEQLEAFAPKSRLDLREWVEKWETLAPIVAVLDDKVVGFAELEPDGHIDCFYVHHEYQSKGIGSALFHEVEKRTQSSGIDKLHAEVSITARSFFESKGLHVTSELIKIRNGVNILNYVMEKDLEQQKIQVLPYDTNWPHLFEREAELIKQALGNNCVAIHHIGSTSVPGLAAKPIIDILPVVTDILEVDECNDAMQKLGYRVRGEHGILFRRFFSKPDFNVHVFECGSPEIERHLKFRDWMQAHPDDLEAYEELKKQLATKYPYDIYAYCSGKGDFVANIDERTGWKGERIVVVLTNQEYEAYHRIKKEQIFAPIHVVYDESHPTLKDPNHFHLVMYSGRNIVSIAHIEFFETGEAALRALATDVVFQNLEYGTHMMILLERWLKHKGIRILKMHARLSVEHFYRALGYVDMDFDDPCIDENYVNLGKILS